jgi:hypothetical protein
MSVSDIPPKVRYLLWAKSAGRCEFDGCNKPMWRDGLTQIEMNFADVAHIIGDRAGGPRGDPVLSKEYRSDVSNLMLMCQEHHRMIDEIVRVYPEEILRQMKCAHEERVERLTAITPDRTSNVIFYKGRIGEIQPKIDIRDAWLAMYPERYPANHLPINLGLVNSSFTDNEIKYWQIESTNLERQFSEKVKPCLHEDRERNHFSIFAFAPQPLLIKLGSLLSDLYPADVYQLHREPATWDWQPGPEAFEYIVIEPSTRHSVVALNLSLSADITSDRIEKVLGAQPYSEWRVTIKNPSNDYLRSKGQLSLFRKQFREVLNMIKVNHGEKAVIHVFLAVPVSVAVEIGRVRQPKAELPFVIYDENINQQGFKRTLSIGVNENE